LSDEEIEFQTFATTIDQVVGRVENNPIYQNYDRGKNNLGPMVGDGFQKVKDVAHNVAEKVKAYELTPADKALVADRMAKGVPIITTGFLSAIQAIKNDDYIACSAALMNICSGSAMLIPPPTGAILGAFLNAMGQVLNFFVVQEPSLEDKIEKLLDHLQSEQQIVNITAVGHSISSYATSLTTKCAGVHKMEEPVMLAGTVSVTSDSKTVTGKGTTFTQIAEVGQWLMFDSDTSRKPYKIDAIGNDTSLTLTLPYVGASAGSTRISQLRRKTIRKGIADILEMPLTSENEAEDFLVEMKALKWGLAGDNGRFDAPRFANWQVAGYLERPGNWRKEGWPEVLGIWCRTYIDLLTANMMLNCLADPETLNRRIRETRVSDKQSLPTLPDNVKERCHKALLDLKSLVSELPKSWESDKKEMLKIVQAIRPAAQERGMYAHVGYWQQGVETKNILYTASGTGSKEDLKWIWKRPYAHTFHDIYGLNSISIHIPNAEKDSFTPKYDVFTCDSDNRIGHYTLDSVKNTISDRTEVISPRPNEKFLDVSAMAPIDPRSGWSGPDWSIAKAYVTLVIENNKEKNNKKNYLNLYVIDEGSKSARVEWQPDFLSLDFNVGVKDLRSLYLPPTTLPADPDADAMDDKRFGSELLAQNSMVFLSYAGVRDINRIHVVVSTQSNYVQKVVGPKGWTSYNGIEVSQNYLWVFGKGGIACATHASINKCCQGKIEQPSWIYHDIGNQFPSGSEVTSLFPCADGTLVANIAGDIYTADYDIVPFSGPTDRHIVTSSWVKRNGKAKQVIKMPIPCWSMLESLRANLQLQG
jgi:hypothetical protein